jgi:hypothetical protein
MFARASFGLALLLAQLVCFACGGGNGAGTQADATAVSGAVSTGGSTALAGTHATGGVGAGGAATGGVGAGGATAGGAAAGGTAAGGATTIPETRCANLPPSGGTVINVTPAQAGTLHELTLNAAAGTTFLLAPGNYAIAGSLRLEKSDLTLRSSTDRASDVVIDAGYTVAEAIVVRASNVTVAHVTVSRAVDHAIHITPPSEGVDVVAPRLYSVVLTDNGEQFLKVNPLGTAAGYIDSGRVECSTFLLTDAGRPHIERSTGGCYTGGIDVHAGRDWVVRDNRFEGIYCAGEGLAEHAIHFWKRSRGTLVENNTIVNCARGIGFGMGDTDTGSRVYPDAPYGGDLGHIDGIIRNNVIYADIDYFDTGIEIMQARQPLVVHNTVVSWTGAGFFSSIDYRFGRTQATVQNNLVRRITARDGATGTLDHNYESVPESYLVAPKLGDFHLTASASHAIDQGVTIAESGLDMDGEPHSKGAPDIGADER